MPAAENAAVCRMSALAKKLHVVLPVSFYERDGNCLYNSVAIIDADGTLLGVYRKTHIPDDHYYQEKFYFTPGNTGFRVWDTKYARIGVGICWDQWFPETARCLALKGAELLFFPTAIGSEPVLDVDSAGTLAALYAGTRSGEPHSCARRQSLRRRAGGAVAGKRRTAFGTDLLRKLVHHRRIRRSPHFCRTRRRSNPVRGVRYGYTSNEAVGMGAIP